MVFKIKRRGRPAQSVKVRSLDNPYLKPKGNWVAFKFDKKNQQLFYKKL